MSDEVEFWPDPHVKFIHIAQMYSELVALSSTGQLYQWKWNDSEPYKHPVEVCIFLVLYINLVKIQIT